MQTASINSRKCEISWKIQFCVEPKAGEKWHFEIMSPAGRSTFAADAEEKVRKLVEISLKFRRNLGLKLLQRE